MLKKLLPVLFIIFAAHSVFSQINYGIKFGMNYSTVKVDNNNYEIDYANQNKYKLGFHIGFVVKIHISNKFSINTELLFSDKGSANDKGDESLYYEFNLYYIDLPIIINYNLNKNLILQLGIEPGYLSSSNFVDYFDEGKFDSNSYDAEIILGAEYYLNRIGIGLRYQQSIIPLYDYDLISTSGKNLGSEKAYNINTQVYFTYLFKRN